MFFYLLVWIISFNQALGVLFGANLQDRWGRVYLSSLGTCSGSLGVGLQWQQHAKAPGYMVRCFRRLAWLPHGLWSPCALHRP